MLVVVVVVVDTNTGILLLPLCSALLFALLRCSAADGSREWISSLPVVVVVVEVEAWKKEGRKHLTSSIHGFIRILCMYVVFALCCIPVCIWIPYRSDRPSWMLLYDTAMLYTVPPSCVGFSKHSRTTHCTVPAHVRC